MTRAMSSASASKTSAAARIHAARVAQSVRRYSRNVSAARAMRASTSAADSASNVFTVVPVAGLIVAMGIHASGIADESRGTQCRADPHSLPRPFPGRGTGGACRAGDLGIQYRTSKRPNGRVHVMADEKSGPKAAVSGVAGGVKGKVKEAAGALSGG